MTQELWWASPSFWRKTAIWVTGVSFIVLIFLTFDTMKYIKAGGYQVPSYSVINKRIDYRYSDAKGHYMPVIGDDEPLFGKRLSEQEAEAMVTEGKLNVQAKNCMDCHTLLGNGAYYAPDLTKSWLDPYWGDTASREKNMVDFLMDPPSQLHNAGGRRMPNLHITEEEARATVAFLKWMSAIDTNGFPNNFKEMDQTDAHVATATAATASAAVPVSQ